MRFATCVSSPAALLDAHMMTHTPADVRVRCVCTGHSSSSSHLSRQLSAVFHRIQAAADARRGGSDEEALEKASSAHTTVSPRSRVPLMRCWSATVAAMDRTRLLPACGGCPQHQCRGCGRLWRPGMTVACGFHEPLLCGSPRLAENRVSLRHAFNDHPVQPQMGNSKNLRMFAYQNTTVL